MHRTSRDERTAEWCRRSLSRFIREAWPILEPATPFVHGWHIDVVAEHLEAVSAGELPRLIINVPPRTMKSLTTCVAWPAWEWLDAPHVRWLFATYAQALSIRDSVKCRRLLQSQGGAQEGTIFQRLGYAGVLQLVADDPWRLTGDQNAKERYENTKTGFRLATSVGGVATGEGGDRIVVDDPLNPTQARSETERANANLWWDETMTSRFNNARATAVIVMQRLHEQDVTGHLLEQGGWHHLCLPAEYEPSHPFIYPDRVELPPLTYNVQAADGTVEEVTTDGGRELAGDPRTEPGDLLEPVRLSRQVLDERLRGLGTYGYAGQYLQRPAPAAGGILKKTWWRRYQQTPAELIASKGPPVAWVQTWDLTFGGEGKAQKTSSGKAKDGSYVVGQVWAQFAGSIDAYLIDKVRGRWPFEEMVAKVEYQAKKWPHARPIVIEKAAAGVPVEQLLKKRVAGLRAEPVTGSKEARAGSVAPFLEAGNFWLPAHEPWADELIDEAAVFPNGSNDDDVDAFSAAGIHLFVKGFKWELL